MLLVMRTTFDAPSGESADRLVYSWGLNGPSPTPANMAQLRDAVEGAWVAPVGTAPGTPVKNMIQSGYSMIFHEVFDAQGGPALGIINAANNPSTEGADTQGPSEVQVCVTRLCQTTRGLTPYGRIYLGPVGSLNSRLVPGARQQLAADWAAKLHANFLLVGYQPQVIAKVGMVIAAGKNIVGYSVDALWDTQRRRGQKSAPQGSKVTVTV